MNRYPGNHMDSGIVTVPRELKTRPGAPQTHLAYITGDEARMLQEHKPGTPHSTNAGIPNYDAWDQDTGSYYTSEQLDYGTSGGSNLGGNESWAAGSSGGSNEPPPSMMTDWSGSISNADAYTPPEQIYGPGQATPGETGYASTNVMASQDSWNTYGNIWKSIQSMDPNTLAFFGYTPGSYNIPNELMTMVAEGSIVSGNEAVETAHLYETGENWASGDPVDHYVGTWNDLESGLHPMFSLDTYYDITNNPNVISTTGTGSGGGGGGGGYGWGGWGSSNLNYGNRSGYGKYADWGNRPFMTQSFDSPMPQYYASLKNPGQPINQRLFMDMVAGMNKGGIMGVRK
jgi:hypothetical protein